MELFPFQKKALTDVEKFDNVAFFHECGLGKTFTGSEKLHLYGSGINLVVCQKSKVDDWKMHFIENYKDMSVYDLTHPGVIECFMQDTGKRVGIINYDLVFRRTELSKLRHFTLMLDESQSIANENSKRGKFILKKMRPDHVVLLSGTPCSGKYEKLWSQCRLLGWDISKTDFWERYIIYYVDDSQGFPIKIVKGYKHVEELKRNLRDHGASFIQSKDVVTLPEQVFTDIKVSTIPDYRRFDKKKVLDFPDGTRWKGDTIFKEILYKRKLCGTYNKEKVKAFMDLVESTEDRLIVFYNFDDELEVLKNIIDRPLSYVNGHVKDLSNYENHEDSVTLIQYQSGSKGLNLQKANKIVYFSPTMSADDWMQSQKRIHRMGQNSTCFYWRLICQGSIEQHIYAALERGESYNERLFVEGR